MGSHLSLLVSATMLAATLVYYYRMVLLTELSTEATLFNTLYAEYATPQMMDALRSVENFSHDTHLTTEQIICRRSDEQLWDRSFDHDWQRLLHWYQKLVYFHRMGLLHDKFYKEFPGASRTRYFLQHVEPFAINACNIYQEENCSDIFDHLRGLYDLPAPPVITCNGQQPKAVEAQTMEKEEL